jgi:hypothetical protein
MLQKPLSIFFSQWWLIIIGSYGALWFVQTTFIFPIENAFLRDGFVASFLFLPHAARVLGAWLYGPKVVFPLLAIALICHTQLVDKSIFEFTRGDIISVLGGVICAPLAFEAMKIMRVDVYPKDDGIISWRTLLFVGIVSSVINSFVNGVGNSAYYDVENTISVLLRYVVGDVAGLFVVLIILVFATRKYRKGGYG